MSDTEIEVGTDVATVEATVVAESDARTGVNVQELFQAALGQGEGGVAALEKLVELEERVAKRNAETAFNQALTAFRKSCPPIPRRNKGAMRHGRAIMYSNFETIQEFADPRLARHGLSYTFTTRVEGGFFVTACRLMHELGHSETAEVPIPLTSIPKATEAQKAVGTISFGKRVALSNALGIATTDDLDGQDMTGETETISDEQAATVREYIDAGHADERQLLEFLGVGSIAEIPANRYDDLLNTLKARAARG